MSAMKKTCISVGCTASESSTWFPSPPTPPASTSPAPHHRPRYPLALPRCRMLATGAAGVAFANGLVLSIGWPCVVAVFGNWFGRSRERGIIMGIWNSNTWVDKIVGSVLASAVLESAWGWAFVLPGVIVALVGALVWASLVIHPGDLGLESAPVGIQMKMLSLLLRQTASATKRNLYQVDREERTGLLDSTKRTKVMELDQTEVIGFLEAWRLPGVAPFACCLFFSKLVVRTFLYWLPF